MYEKETFFLGRVYNMSKNAMIDLSISKLYILFLRLC